MQRRRPSSWRSSFPLVLVGAGGLTAAFLLAWNNPNREFDCEAERYFASIHQPDMTAVVLTGPSKEYEYFERRRHLFEGKRYQTRCRFFSDSSLVIWFLDDADSQQEEAIALVLASRAEE